MNSIVFESVHKVFRQRGFFFLRKPEAETHALKGISLTVSAGEVLGLLGPNGSGKSTTLKLISTMLLPDRGRVVVQGSGTRRQGQAVRRNVGFAMASERSFFSRLTIRENLEFFAALENVHRSEVSDRIESVLSCVSLSNVAGKQVMASAGQQATAMLYRETQTQAQVLAFMDDFRLLAVMYAGLVLLIFFMHRVRTERAARTESADERAIAAAGAE